MDRILLRTMEVMVAASLVVQLTLLPTMSISCSGTEGAVGMQAAPSTWCTGSPLRMLCILCTSYLATIL